MAPHSSSLAWKIPWMEDPGGPQSMGSLRVAAHQAPPSLGFSRQEHWSGLPFPSPSGILLSHKMECISAPQEPVVQRLILEMTQLLLVAASAVDSSTVLSYVFTGLGRLPCTCTVQLMVVNG